MFHQRADHAVGIRHGVFLPHCHENIRLAAIQVCSLLVGGVAMEFSHEDNVDGGFTGHPLVKIELIAVSRYPYLLQHLLPGESMVWHGVIEHTIHVNQSKLNHNANLRKKTDNRTPGRLAAFN